MAGSVCVWLDDFEAVAARQVIDVDVCGPSGDGFEADFDTESVEAGACIFVCEDGV